MGTVKRGYTLLELLIVIALIGILVTIAAVSYSSAQKKTRDSRRTTDVKSIQNALEQYYSDHDGTYPDPSTVESDLQGGQYLPAGWPKDPGSTHDLYAYTQPSGTGSYCLCTPVALETMTGNSDAGCGSFGTGTYYCAKNLQ
jgi:prepilin-type N-terminal cleavage/methylation domain-containing protein